MAFFHDWNWHQQCSHVRKEGSTWASVYLHVIPNPRPPKKSFFQIQEAKGSLSWVASNICALSVANKNIIFTTRLKTVLNLAISDQLSLEILRRWRLLDPIIKGARKKKCLTVKRRTRYWSKPWNNILAKVNETRMLTGEPTSDSVKKKTRACLIHHEKQLLLWQHKQ